jgi:hypothetical protein
MPADNEASDLAHDARNALAVAQGRLQLMRRRGDRGPVDAARMVDDLDLVLEPLRRLGHLVDALERAVASAGAERSEEAQVAR